MRALAAQGVSRDTLPYKAPWQPFFSWYGLFFNLLIIITQGFTAFIPKFSVTDFFINYLSLMLFAVLYIGHKVAFRPQFVKAVEADIDTGRCEEWGLETGMLECENKCILIDKVYRMETIEQLVFNLEC